MSEQTQQTEDQAAAAAEAAAAEAAAAKSTPTKAKATTKAATKATQVTSGSAHSATEGAVKRVKIILQETDEIPPSGQFFGVNGTGYLIKPGVEVEVPEFLLDVIDNAVATKPLLDENNRVAGHREVPRFPYRIVR